MQHWHRQTMVGGHLVAEKKISQIVSTFIITNNKQTSTLQKPSFINLLLMSIREIRDDFYDISVYCH